jgi:hypothetical protein
MGVPRTKLVHPALSVFLTGAVPFRVIASPDLSGRGNLYGARLQPRAARP